MKKRVALVKLIALIIILSAWSLNASAFLVSKTGGGADIKWFNPSATFLVNTSGGPSNTLSAIQASMQTWTDVVPSFFTFVYGGTSSSTSCANYDGVNLVCFGPMGLTGTLAQNAFWYYTASGQLVESDIKFNTDYAWATDGSASAYDVQNVGTHEFGHSLSLADLYNAGDSEKTMYGYAATGETKKRTLDQDDINGITYLYPDTAAPTGSVVINSGATYSTSAGVTLTLTCSDSGSGCSHMQFSNDNSNWSTPEAFSSSKAWTLSSGDGTKTVYTKFRDGAGNWSGAYTDTIVLDTLAPTTTASPAGGTYTSAQSVTLTCNDGTGSGCASTLYCLGAGCTPTTPYSGSINIASSNTIRFYSTDNAGNNESVKSETYTINIDSTPPATTASPAGGTYTSAQSVILTCDDGTGSGCVSTLYCLGTGCTPSTTYSGAINISSSNTLRFYSTDNASNNETVKTETYTIDTAAPTGSVIINSGATYTNSTASTLTLTCSDSGSGCSQMQFSNDNTNWSTPENYATTKSWTLTPSDGIKTVYVKFKDGAGNWSGAYSDTIVLDTALPATTASPAGGTYTSAQSVILTCDDGTGSGCVSTLYCLGTGCTPSTTYSGAINISSSNTLRCYSTDNAGNGETVKTEVYTVNIDATPPITTTSTDPETPDGDNGWFLTSPAVTLTSNEPGTTYYQWDVQESGWEPMASMPTPRWGMGADVINGTIYAIGGWIGAADTGDATNVVEAYDLSTNTWVTKTPMPTPHRYRYFAIYDNKIYVIGGYNNAEGFLNKVEVYDPAIDTWDTSKTPMPTPRRAVYAATINGKIYVIGGAGAGALPGEVIPLDTVEIYDPVTDVWTTGTPMPYARSHTGGAVVDGKIYIIGGWDHQSPATYYTDVEVYDPATDTWQTRTSMPTARARMGMIAVGGKIYSTGGDNASGPLSICEVYDVSTDSWATSPLLSLSSPRTGIPLVAFAGRLFVVGGRGGGIDLGANEATPVSWTTYGVPFNAPEGLHTLYYYSIDTSDNAEIPKSQLFKVDTAIPSGTININSGASYSNSTSVTLTLSCTDTNGCSQVRFSNDNTTWSTLEEYATTKAWDLTSGDGTKTVYAEVKDGAGNWSGAFSDTIVLDATVPTTAVSPLGGTYTSAQNVTLNCADGSGSGCASTLYCLGAGCTPTTSYSGSINISSSNTLRFYSTDNAGNNEIVKSEIYTIDIDTTPPTGTITINAGAIYTNSIASTLTLTCTDSGSGCSQMQFSNDNTNWSAPEAYTATKSWSLLSGDGIKTVYVKFKDSAGNWSSAYTDTIVLDATVPSTSASPVGGPYISAQSVTLTCNDGPGSGCSSTKYCLGSGCTPTTSYTGAINIASSNTLRFYSTDNAANSEAVKTEVYTINIDTTPPTGTIFINSGATYTNSTSSTLTLTCSDAETGCSQMQFSNDNSNWSSPEAYAASKAWTLSSGDGTKTVYVKFKDGAGNWSGAFTDTIILDTTPPVVVAGLNVALNKPAYASSSQAGKPPEDAFDGDRSIEHSWNSGVHPPAWIYVDLLQNYDIAQMLLTIDQTPDGNTIHNIYTSQDAVNWTLVKTLSGYTTRLQTLTVDFDPILSGIRYVKTETTSSPSWVAWTEIEIYEDGNFLNPADSATGVNIATNLSATFNEDMEPSTINEFTFILHTGAAQVNGAVSYDAGTKTAIFNPVGNLDYSTIYTATVTTGVTDMAGNSMVGNKIWSFTTEAFPDTTPPTTAISTDPSSPNGINGWYITTPTITLSSNEPGTTYYRWDSTAPPGDPGWMTYSGPFNPPEGAHTLYYYSVDTVGNPETIRSQVINVDTIVPQVNISSPSEGATVGGTVSIDGTADDANFSEYILEFGSGKRPLDRYASTPFAGLDHGTWWRTITVSNVPVSGGNLASLDTTVLDNSHHTLRLIVKDQAGNTSVRLVRVSIGNSGRPYFEEVTTDPLDILPDISADGQKIAFTSDKLGTLDTWLMNVDGTGLVAIPLSSDDRHPSLSPDGQQVVFISEIEGNFDIWKINIDGTGLTQLTNSPSFESMPTWSHDGQKIVYASDINGNNDIFIMNADGTNQTNLTNDPADDWLPDISPDGTKIAFQSNRAGNYDIWMMNSDGTGLYPVTTDPSGEWHPSFSPDGQRIAFHSNKAGNNDIWVVNTDGTNLQRLTDDPAPDAMPTWSPDGTTIVFASGRSGLCDIYSMNPDGSNLQRLTFSVDDFIPDINDNPSRIVFASNRARDYTMSYHPREIYLVNADGTNLHLVTDLSYSINHPSLSPDGQQIAFMSDMAGNADIYKINVDGTGLTQLTSSFSSEGLPTWRQDGQKIIYISNSSGNNDIYLMNPDGSSQTALTSFLSAESFPDITLDGQKFAFSSDMYGPGDVFVMNVDGTGLIQVTTDPYVNEWHPSFNPNGDKLTFTRVDANTDIYMIDADGLNPVRLTYDEALDTVNTWSPDGNTVVFSSSRTTGDGSRKSIWKMTLADTEAPYTTLSASPSSPNGANGWYITAPTITLSSNEPGTTYYSWISATGPWTAYSAPFTAPQGANTVYYYSEDSIGHIETVKSQLFKVDTIVPTTTASPVGGTYTAAQSVTLTCNDGTGSGCAGTIYCLGAGCTPIIPYTEAINIASSDILRFYSTDNAGINESVKTETYTIQIIEPLTITTSSLPSGSPGVAYSQTLTATGGVPPYTWAISSGNLPNGLTLNSSTGIISGTPSASGTFDFTVQVTDTNLSTAYKNLSISIQSSNSLARIQGTSQYFSDIQSAYDACVDGNILQIQAGGFYQDVYLDREVGISLIGGYDGDFSPTDSCTQIHGILRLTNGTVVMDNICIP